MYISENFFAMRINAEVMAGRIYCKEVSLEEIYKTFATINNIDSNTVEYLKKLEIETEKENVIGIKENINKLKKLKSQGKAIYLI